MRKPSSKPVQVAPIQQLHKSNETAFKTVEKDPNVPPDMPMVYDALDKFGVYSVYYKKDVKRQSNDYNIYADKL